MNVDLFIEFNMIVKHGNLSEAARELNTTQPALSRHLSQIEKEVGAALLDRSKNPMELTYAGERFLQKSSVIANEYQRVISFMQEMKGLSPKRIKVSGIFDSSVSSFLRNARHLLTKTDSNIDVKFVNLTFQTPFDLLRKSELDVAIEPISDLIDTRDLESVKLIHEAAYIVLETNGPLASRESFEANDLKTLECISLRTNKEHAMRKHVQTICKKNGLEGTIPKGLSLSSAETYDDLFLYGLDGKVIVLPESIAFKYAGSANSDYLAKPLIGNECNYDIRAFYLKNCSAETQLFIDVLKKITATQ